MLGIGKTSIGESIANSLSEKGRKMDGTETTQWTTKGGRRGQGWQACIIERMKQQATKTTDIANFSVCECV
jgi:hypothetical protein